MLCGLTLLWTKQFILCVKKGIWPLKHPKNALYIWLYSFKESYQKPHSEDGHWPLAWRQNCASILLMHVHTGSLLFFLDQATGWICPNWNYILLHAFIHHVFNLNILREFIKIYWISIRDQKELSIVLCTKLTGLAASLIASSGSSASPAAVNEEKKDIRPKTYDFSFLGVKYSLFLSQVILNLITNLFKNKKVWALLNYKNGHLTPKTLKLCFWGQLPIFSTERAISDNRDDDQSVLGSTISWKKDALPCKQHLSSYAWSGFFREFKTWPNLTNQDLLAWFV